MVEIRDCYNHLACKGEAESGIIEYAEKHQRFRAVLPIGGSFIVERKGALTTIIRISATAFSIESVPKVA